ncbi:MAG: hydrogenase expression/formation protein HypE [Crenarchaeota archaeon]|nr:hydrogenase expression/formation protein HypE [Thermoproteota archaeon]
MSVTLAHGAGGEKTLELLTKLILSKVPETLKRTPEGSGIDVLDDGACVKIGDKYLIVTMDSYTVNPIFFPGGDLGKLAASGTINDLVAMGARPIAMLDSLIVEEGTEIEIIDKITSSFIDIVVRENIPLIGGDLKVMPRGQLDKIVITVTGLGIAKRPIIDRDLRPGDKIVITGNIAEHGATIMALQQGLDAERYGLHSDCRPLLRPLLDIVEKYVNHIHAMRDPTRGGLAQTLNEWARDTGTLILIYEDRIPIRFEVRKFCEMVGVDPLYLACEGVMTIAVDSETAPVLVEELQSAGMENATIIGEVRESEKFRGTVVCRTVSGGLRIVEPLRGSLVPRIC